MVKPVPMGNLTREEGRGLFGYDAARYDRARPPYPGWVFQRLVDTGLLVPTARILEIGPGSGIATRQLLDCGSRRLTLVEPDLRFVPALEQLAAEYGANCTILGEPFEQANLDPAAFDLGFAATAFHWIDTATGLASIREALRPGGAVALLWNVLQDLDRVDPFHDATQHLFVRHAGGPYETPTGIPWPLDRGQREEELRRAGFGGIEYAESRWTWTIESDRVRDLYESFSHVQRLGSKEREKFLLALVAIARQQFGGRVERYVTTCLYLAWRPGK